MCLMIRVVLDDGNTSMPCLERESREMGVLGRDL